jgi:hypothetical protein
MRSSTFIERRGSRGSAFTYVLVAGVGVDHEPATGPVVGARLGLDDIVVVLVEVADLEDLGVAGQLHRVAGPTSATSASSGPSPATVASPSSGRGLCASRTRRCPPRESRRRARRSRRSADARGFEKSSVVVIGSVVEEEDALGEHVVGPEDQRGHHDHAISTMIVELMTSFLVGHATLRSSPRTSEKNCVGLVRSEPPPWLGAG